MEDAVRELKKKFPISDWLARRLIKLYKGNVGTASHRLITEELGELEEKERSLASDFGEEEGLFTECGKRDGRDKAKEDIARSQPAWMSPEKEKTSRSLCVKCHKVTRGERSFLKKLLPRCCLSPHRIPIRTSGHTSSASPVYVKPSSDRLSLIG